MPRGKPKKEKKERAIYRGIQGLQAEDMKWDNDGEAIIGINRLIIRCRNIYSIYG